MVIATPSATSRVPRRTGGDRRRTLIAWAAVVLTLATAILGALNGPSAGLVLMVSTLSGNASDSLQAVGDGVPFGYAFAVGMAAAFNPCACALLPTYLGLYFGQAAHGEQHSLPVQLPRALLVSVAMTISFGGLFGAAGLALGQAGAALGGLLPWLSVAVGVLLVLAGGRLLAGGSLQSATADRLADALGSMVSHSGLVGYAACGLAFAFSSLGCALPLFLAVVGTAFTRSGAASALGQLVLYALGMGTVVNTLTMLMVLLGSGVVARVRGVGRALQPLGAVLLLLTGGYIVYYWLSAGGLLG